MSLLAELLELHARKLKENVTPGGIDPHDFCDQVDEVVSNEYNLDDGGDLCWNLIEQGTIDLKKHDVQAAAAIVAQHLEQA